MTINSEQIVTNIESVRERITRAAESADRNPNDVKLVVVTKTQPVDVIRKLPEGLVGILGENYVADTQQKQVELGKAVDLFQWHLIGPLQRRKAKHIPSLFSCMHSLDRLSIARKLNQEFEQVQARLPVLLQINIAHEPTKSGWEFDPEKPSADILSEIEEVVHLHNLWVQGLMCMPPFSDDPENSRDYFVALRKVQALLSQKFPDCQFSELSMGTSMDFEVAVQEGATYVRIGESIFGRRAMNV